MSDVNTVFIKLQDLSQFLTSGTLDENLKQQANITASLIGAGSCSIMLINSGDGEDLRMSVCANFGPIPPAAWTTTVGKGEAIAGHVLVTGRSLLIQDIRSSPFAHLARRAEEARRSLMLSPIRIDNKIVGMLNVCAPESGNTFAQVDLHMLDVIAMFIGKSIQVNQLQTILNSRFTQIALNREVEDRLGEKIANPTYQNPHQIAKILAKSFFKEMKKAGFDSAQIISAASEIIGQLNTNLQRHSDRVTIQSEGTD